MKRLALLLALANVGYFAWWRLYPPPSVQPAQAPTMPAGVSGIRLISEVGRTMNARSSLPVLPAEEETPSSELPTRAETNRGMTISAAPEVEVRPLREEEDATRASSVPTSGVENRSDTETGSNGAGGLPESGVPTEAQARPASAADGRAGGPCFDVGPFESRQRAETLAARLAAAGHHAQVQGKREEVVADYWVYLPARSLEEARALLARVVAKGIEDRYLDSKRHLVSLGIYTYRNMAERRRQELEALGFSPRLEPRTRQRTRYRVVVTPSPEGLSIESIEQLMETKVPVAEIRCGS